LTRANSARSLLIHASPLLGRAHDQLTEEEYDLVGDYKASHEEEERSLGWQR